MKNHVLLLLLTAFILFVVACFLIWDWKIFLGVFLMLFASNIDFEIRNLLKKKQSTCDCGCGRKADVFLNDDCATQLRDKNEK